MKSMVLEVKTVAALGELRLGENSREVLGYTLFLDLCWLHSSLLWGKSFFTLIQCVLSIISLHL